MDCHCSIRLPRIIRFRPVPFVAAGDYPRFIDGLWGINEAAQLNHALVSFHPDRE